MSYLFHITGWPYAGPSALSPESLGGEGFVHLSTAQQLLRTAERWYSHEDHVGLLVLDQEELGAALRWEDLYDHGEAFPHLYSAIPAWSVAAVVKLERDASGSFRWPGALRGSRSPLLEGPDPGEALIEPKRRFPQESLPELAVLTFFPQVMQSLLELPGVEVHRGLTSPIGPDPILVLERDGRRIAVCSPGVGGPLASVALEELIALGCRKFAMCGGAGSLRSEQDFGQLVLVKEAWRDEGVSLHYLDPGPSVFTDPASLEQAAAVLERCGVAFQQGRTWTTDALYRETPARISRRRDQGCLTVEMEAASLLAVAQYRGAALIPMLYCGDDLGSDAWDFRNWTQAHQIQDKLFWLAVEVVLGLAQQSPAEAELRSHSTVS